MILACCHKPIPEAGMNWDAVTAIGTGILAIVTIALAFIAIRQLLDVKKFNKDSEILSNVQSAENMILKQIEFHYNILERIEIDKKDIFKNLYENLTANFGFAIKTSDPEMEMQIREAYSKLYQDHGYLLGHYFRNLYRIFKRIDETKISGFDENNKKSHAKLVRAQLSEYEVLLLFYNCIWIGDNDKFKLLVEKYELLEGINYDKLIDREGHSNLYSNNAYGKEFT